MPHRIISSIISSQLTGGTFLAVLGNSSQLHQRVHKPSLILHCSPCSHPVLLLLVSSWSFSFSAAVVLFSRGSRASMGSRWWSELKFSGETSRGDWQQSGFEVPSLEEAPLKAPVLTQCEHPADSLASWWQEKLMRTVLRSFLLPWKVTAWFLKADGLQYPDTSLPAKKNT